MTASPTERGFSLIEVAIAIILFGLLLKLVLGSYSALQQQSEHKASRTQLEQARESILAFLIEHGRLPCPASKTQGGGQEDCTRSHGQPPWRSLGIPETDIWGRRLTYFAASSFRALPNAGEQAGFDLKTGIAPSNTGLASIRNSLDRGGKTIAIDIACVLVMHGRNGLGSSADERENQDEDLEFVSDAPSPTFDDQLLWIGPGILKARLIAAGKLP